MAERLTIARETSHLSITERALRIRLSLYDVSLFYFVLRQSCYVQEGQKVIHDSMKTFLIHSFLIPTTLESARLCLEKPKRKVTLVLN